MSMRPGCKQPPSTKGMSLEAVGGLGERVSDWAATQSPALRKSALGLTFCCHCLGILTMFSVRDPPFHSARSQSCWEAVDTEGYLQGGHQRVLRLQGSCHLLSASRAAVGGVDYSGTCRLTGLHMCWRAGSTCVRASVNRLKATLSVATCLQWAGFALSGRRREAGKECQGSRRPHLPAKTERPANNSKRGLSLCPHSGA